MTNEAERIDYPFFIPEIWASKALTHTYRKLELAGKLKGTNIDYEGHIQRLGDTIRYGRRNVLVQCAFSLHIGPLDEEALSFCQTNILLMNLLADHVADMAASKLMEAHPKLWRLFALQITAVQPMSTARNAPEHLLFHFVYHITEKGKRHA